MDFAFSEEQQMLRAAARDYLADRWPVERVVEAVDAETAGGPPVDVWREVADLGWLDPELGFLEQAVLFEETGAALLPAPYFATAALALPLVAGTSLADDVAAGERSLSLLVDGFVPDAGRVSDVLVVAGDEVHQVDARVHPEAVLRRSTLDRTRPLGVLATDAPREAVAGAAVVDVRDRALAALACEAVGVAQRALDLAAEHAKTRQQFGRVIGTYQGVSHKVADIYAALELARSLAYWAAWCVAESDAQAPLAAAAAKSAAAEAAVFACESAIQVLGGIGFTWDHVLHRYYKRAQWIESYDGTGRSHRARIAESLLA